MAKNGKSYRATHAVLQPLQQPRPYPCHPFGRRQPRSQRLPQGQVRREARRIRGRPPRTPHRRIRRLRHPLYRLQELPVHDIVSVPVSGVM